MSHKKLLELLRFCPISDYFGMLKDDLNAEALCVEQARRHAFEMINQFEA